MTIALVLKNKVILVWHRVYKLAFGWPWNETWNSYCWHGTRWVLVRKGEMLMLHLLIQWDHFQKRLCQSGDSAVWDSEHIKMYSSRWQDMTCRVCISLCRPHQGTSLCRCLRAGRAGGALQRGLREASGQGADVGVCQRGGREQLIPAANCGRQVQVLQEDLSHSHEALVVHTPIVPPYYYLHNFALRTFIEQQSLLVRGVQVPLYYFGFLLCQTRSIFQ